MPHCFNVNLTSIEYLHRKKTSSKGFVLSEFFVIKVKLPISDTAISPGGYQIGEEPDSLSPYDQQVLHLEKQLDIECKVKQGADNMIAEYSSSHGRDKKLLMEAQLMSADSKAKIEYLRMRLMKLKQTKEMIVKPPLRIDDCD